MALPPPLGPRFPSEPLNYPAGAPRELDIARCTICPASGEKRIRPEQAQKLGQDSLDPPEHFQGGLRGTEPAAGPLRLPAPSSSEDPAGGRHRETPRPLMSTLLGALKTWRFCPGPAPLGRTPGGSSPGADQRWTLLQKEPAEEGWQWKWGQGLGWPTDPDSVPCVPQHLISGQEVLEAEQDSLSLCLLGLGLRLQDLEQGLGPWASAQSGMVQLQALQADLCGAAERVDALLAFGEGLAQRSEPQARASLEQVLRALRAHRDGIFRQLWWLQAQLVSYSLVFEEASTLDQDLEVEGDLDGPGPGGAWGPWAPSSLPTPAELEWDPAGDVGGLRPLGRKTAWTPGAPCELCGHRVPEGRGQGLEVRAGHAHVGLQPPETLSRSAKTLPGPEASGQEAGISQPAGCDVGGRPWSPSSCIQVVPDLPHSPPLPSPRGCHIAPATVRGVLLLSCPTGQDTSSGAQLCQWSPPSLRTWPRHM
ncbi:nesprin-4 isoform X1 [Panthera pardus]|uniref:Nesprin-4 isoform X1 n=1 Tax=Panthera pardus TaxID=9691 RepID=A0A9V1EC95_PANPR|nr:nesprin-4 isoform X1 [Panthera pardus]